ncbi:hypothetical protein [Nocardioides sp.]|uniref:hypothetical protein n=1 Tax=Nocardioides sp. TaxID=35761 RepID=UPI002B271A5E|nr:hypothetical protein [Nocardioides sp.]
MPEHTPGTSRRRVLKGAAWTAPAIVLATAAPTYAASGRAAVTTLVLPATHTHGVLSVTIDFINRNTESTGLTTAIVTCSPTPGSGTVVRNSATRVTNGWQFIGSGNSTTAPTFSFSRDQGIDGAPTADSTATTRLHFRLEVLPNEVGQSAGTISVQTIRARGDATGGSGTWA